MKILGLIIPEGQRLYFWNCGGDCGTLLFAKDYDDAYAKCIQSRLSDDVGRRGFQPPTADEVMDACRWFVKNDTLEEVTGEYTGPAFDGPLPDAY